MQSMSLRGMFLGLCASAALLLPACAGDDSETDSNASDSATTSTSGGSTGSTGGEMGDGVTDCTPPGLEKVVCQAGQYCADQVLAECENGCLSNDNCTSEQTCEKAAGEDVGTCQNTAPDGPTLDEFCMKLLTCDPSGTMDQCTTIYNGTNEGCHNCIVDGNCGDINDGSCDASCGV
ncbi:MAG: hypothetical protein R3A79_04255 [Nannocystaceae bacterium]